jgi:hypothetical protein
MKIEILKFVRSHFVDLAIDRDNGVFLIGIPFDYGGSGHTRYYEMSKEQFDACLEDESNLSAFERNGQYLGKGTLYWSDFAPDLQGLKK